jgi:hypothetical protein
VGSPRPVTHNRVRFSRAGDIGAHRNPLIMKEIPCLFEIAH